MCVCILTFISVYRYTYIHGIYSHPFIYMYMYILIECLVCRCICRQIYNDYASEARSERKRKTRGIKKRERREKRRETRARKTCDESAALRRGAERNGDSNSLAYGALPRINVDECPSFAGIIENASRRATTEKTRIIRMTFNVIPWQYYIGIILYAFRYRH